MYGLKQHLFVLVERNTQSLGSIGSDLEVQ